MRLWVSVFLAALGCAGAVDVAVAAAPDVSGTWLIEDRGARVRVERCGSAQDRLCGYVVWIRPGSKGPTIDSNNPEPKKAKRAILGHQIMLGLKANDEDQWEGLIYNAQDGKTYDVTVWPERANVLKVKGCLVAFLCSTQTWTMVTDTASGQLTGATGAQDGPQPDPEWAAKPARAGSGSGPKRDSKPRS